MSRMHLSLISSFLLLISFASAAGQNSAPEAVATDFVTAWNTHDMKAFDRLFTDDAIWVPVAEAMDEGRANILRDLEDIHATWAANTKIMTSGAIKVQRIRPDVAVVLFHMGFQDANGKLVPVIDRAMIIVTVKEKGAWKIATGQITKQHVGE